ncbi:MAG: hypothetical protein AMXMBFR64_24840 [Myxococcales bacterium]
MRRTTATTLALLLLGTVSCASDSPAASTEDTSQDTTTQPDQDGATGFPDTGGGVFFDVATDGGEDAVPDASEDVPDVGEPGLDVVTVPDTKPDVPDSGPEDTGPEDVPDTADEQTPDVADTLDVTEDTGPDVVATTGSVEGVVWRTNGDPVKGAPVSVVGQPNIQALTDGQGLFLLEDLPPGKITLLAGPTVAKEAGLGSATIVAGSKANAGIVTVAPVGSAKGSILAVDAPTQDGTVVSMKGTSIKSNTNSLGVFALPSLPPACVTLSVERTGYQGIELEACITSGQTLDLGAHEIWLEGVCVTQCLGKVCGDDGCGGQCGTCPGKLQCAEGACVVGGVCGDAKCESEVGETCANCASDCGCGVGVCVGAACCFPSCGGAECGGDGCGGVCGTCAPLLSCSGGVCLALGETCGDGACDPEAAETCKTCVADCSCGGGLCMPDQTCCTPSCEGLACGGDGCGGSCGSCAGSQICVEGQCVIECQGVPPGGIADVGPLPAPAPSAPVVPWTGDGFSDDYLVGPSGTWRVGLRRDWGGAMVYLGPAGAGPGLSSSNLLDPTNGTRALRVALWDPTRSVQGCAWNASCEPQSAPCPAGPSFLGWNPVQGINECGSLPGVATQELVDGRLRTTATLLQWNPDWSAQACDNGGCFDPGKQKLPSDIHYEQSVRWVLQNTLELQMTMTNLGGDHHALADQDLPIVWGAAGANGTTPLVSPMDADGKAIPLTPAPGGLMTATFESTGGWAMLLDGSQASGIGLFTENGRNTFQVVLSSGQSVRLRAPFHVEIPPYATVRGRVYLILGDADTIRSTAGKLRASLGPFGAIESPGEDEAVSQTLHVSGWVLDDEAVTAVELLVDGVKIADLPLVTDRPDVCILYPGYASCGTIGFEGHVSLAGLSPCAHLAVVRATDSRGNKRVVDTVRFQAAPGKACTTVADCEDGDHCTIDVCDPLLACVRGPKPKADLKEESCNGIDDDCDGLFDEAPAKGCLGYFQDADEDAWGTSAMECLCKPEYPYTAFQSGDCDDEDPGAWPGAPETCNGVDDDCDGQVDEPGAGGCVNRWPDGDGDGWGTGAPACLCEAPGAGTVTVGGDCDDKSIQVNPGMPEVCNGMDDDCDGQIEAPGVCPPGVHFVYRYLFKTDTDADHSYGASKTPPAGSNYDGFGFVLYDESGPERLPLFQAKCAACTDHKQSTDVQEGFPDYASPTLLGYCRSAPGDGAERALVRLYSPALTDHFSTTYAVEIDAALAMGYELQGTLCWVP